MSDYPLREVLANGGRLPPFRWEVALTLAEYAVELLLVWLGLPILGAFLAGMTTGTFWSRRNALVYAMGRMKALKEAS